LMVATERKVALAKQAATAVVQLAVCGGASTVAVQKAMAIVETVAKVGPARVAVEAVVGMAA